MYEQLDPPIWVALAGTIFSLYAFFISERQTVSTPD